LLNIARKAQLLYTYSSSSKEAGSREIYYMPNRILCPDRGLDPVGQHARVSLTAESLFLAASENKKIPLQHEEKDHSSTASEDTMQGELFHE
jgi:hypothetical protein